MKKASSVIATSAQMPAPLTYSTSRTSESSAAAGIEPMPARQLPGLAVDLAGELAEGDDGAGEGHRADEHAEEHLDLQDRDLHAVLCASTPAKPVSASARPRRGEHAGELEVGVEADEHGGETDEGVQRRHQLRHLGHRDRLGHIPADGGADHQHHGDDGHSCRPGAEHGCPDGERHAGNAVPDGALGALLARQAAERQDEQDGGRHIGGRDDTKAHRTILTTSGTWPASGV